MNIRSRKIVLVVAATAVALLAIVNPQLRILGIGLAVGILFGVASSLSAAGKTARKLQPFLGSRVRVRVWDEPLPIADNGSLIVHAVRGVGLGLLIHLRANADERPILLKVAQPSGVTVSNERTLKIENAGYVQWSRRRLQRPADSRRIALEMETVA